MKTSFLKDLDAALSPAMCALGALSPKPGDPPPGKTLIVRPGGMGDLICADIALQEMSLEDHPFTWLIESRAQPWAEFRGLPHLCYDVKPLEVLREVWNQYELVINTEQLFGLAQAYALLARTKKGRVVSFATNRGALWADATVAYDWKDRHETIEFARLFAVALKRPEVETKRRPRPRREPVSGPPLVMVAGRQSPSRCLDFEAWTALIGRWHRARPFLIGATREDAAFADALARSYPGQARRLEGSFAELCETIARSEEIFTMDGGAVHIASYFGVPAFTLFTSGRDGKWHPLGEGSQVLRRHDLACQPCTKFGQVPPCPYNYACLKLDHVAPVKPG